MALTSRQWPVLDDGAGVRREGIIGAPKRQQQLDCR